MGDPLEWWEALAYTLGFSAIGALCGFVILLLCGAFRGRK